MQNENKSVPQLMGRGPAVHLLTFILLLELNCWTPNWLAIWMARHCSGDAHFVRISHVKRKCVIYFIWIECCATQKSALSIRFITHTANKSNEFENCVFILSRTIMNKFWMELTAKVPEKHGTLIWKRAPESIHESFCVQIHFRC